MASLKNKFNKNFFFLAIPFGLVMLFLFGSIFLSPAPNQQTPPSPQAATPTPIDVTTEAWFDELPLQTTKYFVYYDTEKHSLIGLLYPDTYSSTSIDKQVVALKNEILKKLKDLGVNTSQIPISWKVTPVP